MATPIEAAVTNWTVQSSSSSLTVSGALSSGGTFLASLLHQGPGSLVTQYSGNIVTDLSGSDIQFLSADIEALNSGNWDPLPGGGTGLAPGNYGFDITGGIGFLGGINAVLRNLAIDISSGALASSGSPSEATFGGSLDMALLSASMDYRGIGVHALAIGASTISTFTGENGILSSSGIISYGPISATLTIPVQFRFTALLGGADTTTTSDDIGEYFVLSGTIQATAVPEASSLALLGLAGSIVGFLGYRRSRNLTS
jgi:hypothetical protein